MKTSKIVWTKTILFAYKYLESMCNGIDKIIENIAVGSFYYGGSWDDARSCENVSRKIIRLSNKKIDYINLKVLVEQALKNLKESCAKILILRHIKELSVATICNLLNLSERTFFRRIALAEKQFMFELENLGYNEYKLEIKYLSDDLIKSIYNVANNTTKTDNLIAHCYDNNMVLKFIKEFANMIA